MGYDNEEYLNNKKEWTSTKFRRELKEKCGTKCVNCGSEEGIEYHHIVPLRFGGTNNFSNIVPLCHKCHEAAHRGQHISHYLDFSSGGRPSKATIEENSDVYDMYINGEIGNRKINELLGYSDRTPITTCLDFKKYLAKLGIKRIHNIVDVAATCGKYGLYDGECVGTITWNNNEVTEIIYKDTGANDVKYVKRKNTEYKTKVK